MKCEWSESWIRLLSFWLMDGFLNPYWEAPSVKCERTRTSLASLESDPRGNNNQTQTVCGFETYNISTVCTLEFHVMLCQDTKIAALRGSLTMTNSSQHWRDFGSSVFMSFVFEMRETIFVHELVLILLSFFFLLHFPLNPFLLFLFICNIKPYCYNTSSSCMLCFDAVLMINLNLIDHIVTLNHLVNVTNPMIDPTRVDYMVQFAENVIYSTII